MTDNMIIAMCAINKWLYFGWNYTTVRAHVPSPSGTSDPLYIPQFLAEVKWTCNLNHMIDKWKRATRNQHSDAWLVRFYAELDSANRRLLLEWVLKNYNNEKPL